MNDKTVTQKVKHYFYNLLYVLPSHIVNTLTGGDPDSCLCERMYFLSISGNKFKHKFAEYFCRFIDFFNKGHCRRASGAI